MPKKRKKQKTIVETESRSWEPRPTRLCPKNLKHIATQLAVPVSVNGEDLKIYYCNDCPDIGRYIVYADGR